jgi:hypothetical protein
MSSSALLELPESEMIVNHVDFGPYAFLLEAENKTLFKCERGFFWVKDQAPEIVTTGRRDEWGPNKSLIHYRDASSRLVPFREDLLNVSWKKSISYASLMKLSEIEASGKIIIDCRV